MKIRFIIDDLPHIEERPALPVMDHQVSHQGNKHTIREVVHLLDDDEADVEVILDRPDNQSDAESTSNQSQAGVFLRKRHR